MTIAAKDSMLMIVDYQERLLPAMHDCEALSERSRILIEGLAILDVPMIITQQYTKGLGMSVPFVFAAAGTDVYMDKTEFSAMRNQQIAQTVSSFNKKSVIVCGIEAHICVLQTCLDLKEQGFSPSLVLDCIGSRKRSEKEMTVIRAQQEGITVTSAESLLFELLGEAGGEAFKQISKLIK